MKNILKVVGPVVAVIGLYLTLTAEKPLSSEQQRLVALVPLKVGGHCRGETDEISDKYEPLISASIQCQPADPAPESLHFRLFTAGDDLREYMRRVDAQISEDDARCSRDYGGRKGPWTDRAGEVRGEFICAEYGTRAEVVWSDDQALFAVIARSPASEMDPLREWWQRSVKFEADGFPSKSRQRLLAMLPSAFGECEPDGIGPTMAIVGVTCEPGDGIDYAGAALFPSGQLLDEFIEAQAERSGITDKGCRESTYSYSEYGPAPDYEPTTGHLLCYVNDGAQWFVWTADQPRVYAYAARTDESLTRLYDAWAWRLSQIEAQP